MSKFYEILQKLQKPEVKQPKKLLFRRLTLALLLVIFLSSIGFFLLVYYVKQKLISPQKFTSSINQTVMTPPTVSVPVSTTNTTSPLSNQTLSNQTGIIKTFKSPSYPSISKKVIKRTVPVTSSIQFPSSPSNFNKATLLLTKDDLINNLLILAEEERKKGHFEKAILYYQSYLREKENPSVMNNYGACLIELGKLDEAIKVLNQAISIKNDPEIKFNLLIAYFKKGERERACKELQNLNFNPLVEDKLKNLQELCK